MKADFYSSFHICEMCTWAYSKFGSVLSTCHSFLKVIVLHTGTSSVGTQVLLLFCGGELLRMYNCLIVRGGEECFMCGLVMGNFKTFLE